MVEKEDWGPVYCTDGPHKGRIGYYDDDEMDDERFDSCVAEMSDEELDELD